MGWPRHAIVLCTAMVAGSCSATQQPQPAKSALAPPAKGTSSSPQERLPADPPPVAISPAPAKTSTRTLSDEPATRIPREKRSARAKRPSKASRVLIVGDSMAATDFGRALERLLDRAKGVTCARRGKSATGLARPDYFDWMREAERQVKRHSPELVVVIIGGNDGQDLIDRAGKRRRVVWRNGKWDNLYAERTRHFLDRLQAGGAEVAWLELPKMDHRSLEKKLSVIRRIQRSVVTSRKQARYVETAPIFLDAKGALIRKIPHGRKKRRRVLLRQKDGIHFSLHGSRYFANKVLPLVLALLPKKPPAS